MKWPESRLSIGVLRMNSGDARIPFQFLLGFAAHICIPMTHAEEKYHDIGELSFIDLLVSHNDDTQLYS